MRLWRRFGALPGWLKVFMVGQFTNAAGAFAWFYLTLYLVTDRHLDPQAAGLITAAYGLGVLLGNLGGGWFGDRFGMRRALLVGLTGWAGLCLIMPLAPAGLLAVVGALAGACSGAARPLGNALVATALPAERRREGVALSRTATNAGFVVGPPLGALLAGYDFTLVFLTDAATSLLLVVIVWWKLPAGGRPAHAILHKGLWRELAGRRDIIVLLAAVLVVDTVFRQLYTSLPLLLRDAGVPAIAYGLLITLNAAVIVLGEAPLAVVLRRHSARRMIAGGFALVALGFVALAAWPALGGAIIAVLVVTAGEMLYKPTATAHVVDAAPEGMAGRFSSLYAAASIGGMMLAPALGGVGYQHLPGLLWTLAALAAFVAAAAMWLLGRPPVRAPEPLAART